MILIQCTQSKRDSKAKAKDLYDESDYFVKMRRYAQATGEEWAILSARHGLVHPETELEPYDAYGLSETQAEVIADQLVTQDVDEVTLVAGSEYADPLTPAVERRGIDVTEKCRGLRIGARMEKLDTLRAKLENERIC